MPESSLGGVPTFCLCGLHDSLTYEYLKKSCKTSLFHFYLIIINIMLLFIRTSQAKPNPNHNNTITHGPRPECSPSCPPCTDPILWDTLFIVGATSRSVQLSFIGCNGRKFFSVRSVPGLPRASVFRSDTEAISPPL